MEQNIANMVSKSIKIDNIDDSVCAQSSINDLYVMTHHF